MGTRLETRLETRGKRPYCDTSPKIPRVISYADSKKKSVCTEPSKPVIYNAWTLNGEAFVAPETKSFATQQSNLAGGRSIASFIPIILGFSYLAAAYFGLVSKNVAILYLIAWRLAYNLGLGYIFYKQDSCDWLVKKAQKLGFGKLEKGKSRHLIVRFLIKCIEIDYSLPKIPYDYNAYPVEYNTWILVRYLVDIILINECFAYMTFFLMDFRLPQNNITLLNILRYSTSICLILISVWTKTLAHNVLSDYAWYWGDFFFKSSSKLSFDGVFNFVPHPMYTIGYSWAYGLSLLCGSSKLFFLSVFMHISQLLFLNIVETTHMDKIYQKATLDSNNISQKLLESTSNNLGLKLSTCIWKPTNIIDKLNIAKYIIYIQTIVTSLILPSVTFGSNRLSIFFLSQALFWITLRTFGIGLILFMQYKYKSWTNFFSKKNCSLKKSFTLWKFVFDLANFQSYSTFFLLSYKFLSFKTSFISESFLIRLTICLALCVMQIWMTNEAISRISLFNWYCGNIFVDDKIPYKKPVYDGIYRYIDHPLTYITSVWGLSLLSNSLPVYVVAIYFQLSLFLITKYIEEPHLKKLYGKDVRNDSGASEFVNNEIKKLSNVIKKSVSSYNLKLAQKTD